MSSSSIACCFTKISSCRFEGGEDHRSTGGKSEETGEGEKEDGSASVWDDPQAGGRTPETGRAGTQHLRGKPVSVGLYT